MKCKPIILLSVILSSSPIAQAENGAWFVRPYAGFSAMSDLSANTMEVGTVDGSAQISLSGGFTSGIGLGYRYNDSWAVELAWEYRSNDSEVSLADGQQFAEGNYASNTFLLNSVYYFSLEGKWQPYLGVGLSWVQEVDIDLETRGEELSYSGDGDIGLQAFAGMDYLVSEQWSLGAELRYGSLSGIALSGEEGAQGRFDDLDYQPTTLQLGATFRF